MRLICAQVFSNKCEKKTQVPNVYEDYVNAIQL